MATPEIVPGAEVEVEPATPEAPGTTDLLANLPAAPAAPESKGWIARLFGRNKKPATPAVVTTEGAPGEENPLEGGNPTFTENGEEVPAMPSRARELWNNLRERAGNISNPITGPRVKTAAKVGAILTLLAGAGYGVKKGFDYITDGAEATPAPVEPVPVTPTTQWTPRSTGLDTNNDGSISKEECAGPLAKSGGKTVYVYNCKTGVGSYCTFGADPKLDTTVERSFTETAFNNYKRVELPECTTDYQETTLVSK